MAIPGKESENGVYEFPYMKPVPRGRWEAFRSSLYDPVNGTVLGRTGKSWFQILVFYTIFYAALAALFAICMQGLFATLDMDKPSWIGEASLIGTNPGLGFRPISNRTEEGSLIWYNSRNDTTVKKWVHLLDEFTEPYRSQSEGKENIVQCDFGKQPGPGKVCAVDLTEFQHCSPKNSYGYNTSSPCVYLKLNRIYGWEPDYYDDPNDLPKEMPEELKQHIAKLKQNPATASQLKQIWVTCEGESPADKENVSPNFDYLPYHGFPGYYYPYTNVPGYLSPLVAVSVKNPTPNVMINIECRAWAKNIHYSKAKQTREGSIHFEIMRDTI